MTNAEARRLMARLEEETKRAERYKAGYEALADATFAAQIKAESKAEAIKDEARELQERFSALMERMVK